jgi:hypothetical protein
MNCVAYFDDNNKLHAVTVPEDNLVAGASPSVKTDDKADSMYINLWTDDNQPGPGRTTYTNDDFTIVLDSADDTSEYSGLMTGIEIIGVRAMIPLPTIEFTGTVKLHGTNAAISVKDGALAFQSRNHLITPIKDNMGFAAHFSSSTAQKEVCDLVDRFGKPGKTVVLFGEWCGENIQKGVALCELKKMFVLFDVYVVEDNEWLSSSVVARFSIPELRIFNIYDFPTYSVSIDFNNPDASVEEMNNLVEKVDRECPVAKHFQVTGPGEGIVWKSAYGSPIRFKTKGSSHMNTKGTAGASVSTDKLAGIAEFVEYSVTENRLEQGIEQLFHTTSTEPTIKHTGAFIKWVLTDIVKEEIDTLSSNGLCVKDVSSAISNKAREWYRVRYH